MTDRDTTRRTHDPVPPLTLVELRSLSGAVGCTVAVKYDNRITNLLHTIGGHLTDGQYGVELTTGIRPSIHQIATTILVPQRSRVDHSLPFDDTFGGRPFTSRILCRNNKDTQVGVTPVNIIGLVILIITDRRCPHPIAMLRDVITLQRRQRLNGIIDNLPIDQVLGVQDRQPWDAVERGGGQVKILTTGSHTDIRVRVVGINHGVGKCTVTIVRRPHLRLILSAHGHGDN